ncbi:hypothetical protein [Micromonospora sp. DT233]|uniref:hypothetical protein n=1 Tax=Micromonospora sp. DT233 TaxID=3393432 RepID=UPI003CE9B2AD
MHVGDGWPAAYKEYNADALRSVDRAALEAMARFPGQLPADQARELLDRVAWPTAVVERGGRLSGFLMRQVPPAFKTRLRLPNRYVDDKIAQVQLLLNDDAYRTARDLPVDDVFQLELLRDTAAALDAFHRLDLFVGDLSPNNLLFSRTTRPRCFFIDCDTMRLRGVSVLPQVETIDWEVPRAAGEQLASVSSDSYKFALLCVRLFAGDQTTRDVGPLGRVGAEVRGLAERGLSADSGGRPAPAQWLAPLDRAIAAARKSPSATKSAGTTTATSTSGAKPSWPSAPGGPRPPNRATTAPGVTRPAGPTRPVGRPQPAPVAPRPAGPSGPARSRLGTIFKIALVGVFLLCVVPRLGACAPWWDSIEIPGAGGTTQSSAAAEASSAAEQAERVADLLALSGRDRRRIAPAVQKVIRCTGLSGAAADFDEAGEGRRTTLEQARGLRTDRLRNGAALLNALVSALTHSAAADDAYARWARAVARSGCESSAMTGADRDEGDRRSKLATAAKKRFVALWTPLAEQYGAPKLSYLDI